MPAVLNPVRSRSGISVVTVLTKPYPCPGRCVYCPTEVKAPKSYLLTEPLVQRAAEYEYDPYRQTAIRLQALRNTGHPTAKIELMVKGGTWSYYPQEYQRQFIRECLDAANRAVSSTLEEAQQLNETAEQRIVGLTVETRPDYVTPEEIRRLRELGVTRVELGVQSLDEGVLKITQRDHGTDEIRRATKLLRDAGFKVGYHLMPNLPGASPESDRQTLRTLFDDPGYRPDSLKIYPCVVVESAALYGWWKDGRYRPYDEETLIELLIDFKRQIPPYVRIERIARDIAAPLVRAGSRRNNLREEILTRMKRQGFSCRCIRCREVQFRPEGKFALARRDFEAAGGKEIFLSFEDPATDRLAALLRLRIPSDVIESGPAFPELVGAALVRELHTYGQQLPLGARSTRPLFAQHQGFGRRLMAEAERIAFEEFGLRRMAVISGIGVREYYRKLGYTLEGTYMVKRIITRGSRATRVTPESNRSGRPVASLRWSRSTKEEGGDEERRLGRERPLDLE